MQDILADMTLNNPIFVFAVITTIWFIPGIIIRGFAKKKYIATRKKEQKDAIEKLYPKK